MRAPELVQRIALACARAGGEAWVVGGSVRDALLGRAVKDWDLEVHGLSRAEVGRLLGPLGASPMVGRSFGVYKVRAQGLEVDVALPREGASPGEPVTLTEALRRRDLTMNAIAWNPLSEETCDPFGGAQDIRARRLRAVDRDTFLEDPLRVLRVVQLAPRFGFEPDDELREICRGADLRGLPAERVFMEVEKLLLSAARPSEGLALARALGALEKVLPELVEAPVEATHAALDRAATRRAEAGPAPRDLVLMLAALHHALPAEQARASLERLGVHTRLRYPVRARALGAVACWSELAVPTSDATLRRLAEIEEVGLVAETAWAATGAACALEAKARAEALGVLWTALPPLLTGRDLMSEGVPSGPAMGQLLSQVRDAQIEGKLNDPEQALGFVRLLRGTLVSEG